VYKVHTGGLLGKINVACNGGKRGDMIWSACITLPSLFTYKIAPVDKGPYKLYENDCKRFESFTFDRGSQATELLKFMICRKLSNLDNVGVCWRIGILSLRFIDQA